MDWLAFLLCLLLGFLLGCFWDRLRAKDKVEDYLSFLKDKEAFENRVRSRRLKGEDCVLDVR